MTERAECGVCGIPFHQGDLVEAEGAAVCPRCFALQAPGTLEGGVGSSGGRAGPGRVRATGAVAGSAATDAAAGAVPGRALAWLRGSVRDWAVGRTWWIRAPVLAWMVWILVHYWAAPWYSTLWQGIDLVLHEMGHILWSPLGEFMGFAGGTLTQLLVPVAACAVLYRQRDWFGIAIAICWLGINCFEIVEYAGDALARQLPLVSPVSASPEHDWTYMLSRLGILQHTDAVAAGWQWAGRLFMSGGVLFGGWVLWIMSRLPGGHDGAVGVG